MSATRVGGRRPRSAIARIAVVAALLVAAPGLGVTYLKSAPSAFSAASAATGDPVVVAGGDIACRPGRSSDVTKCQHGKTATLVQSLNPTVVLPLGDTQYDSGATTEYQQSYDPTWGAFKAKSHPAVGNHEYMTSGAAGYYGYFGGLAGDPAKGYYSYNVAGPTFLWHVISLNTECAQIGGCGVGSAQETWLKNDLAANKNVCTLAYSHRPRFSSGSVIGSSSSLTPFFQDLYNGGVDLFLSGHAHHYERFSPQTPSGVLDTSRGVTQFVVGTGGDDFQGLDAPEPNSVVRQNTNFGVLKLTLHASSYDYAFAPASGYTFTDAGSGTCHNAPASDTTRPTAPTGLTATAPTSGQVNLSWTAATDNVAVKNYQIYRGSNGATPALLATTSTNATTFSDTSVTGGTPYTYQVYAQDAAGNVSPASNTASLTTPTSTDTTPPSAPTGVAIESISSSEIDLGWGASTDAGTGVSGYRVYRQGPGESTFKLLSTTSGPGTTYVDSGVSQGSTYSYYVTAYDGAGLESAHSSTVSATTPTGPTSKTFTFTAAGDATIQQANPTATGGTTSPLTVDNSPVKDVMMKFAVATSGCESLTSATLTLKNNNDGSTKGGDVYTTGPNWTESAVTWATAPTRGTLLNSLGAVAVGATATVDVTGGVPNLNGEADFRIGTTSSDGVTYQSREGTVKPTLTVVCATSAPVPDTLPPSAPSGLSASAANSGEVDLSWAASSDNVGVTNYDVYRGGALVGTVPGGSELGSSLTYQDTTVAPSTTYSYTVKARDAANNTSAASNTVSVTTPAATAAPNPPANLVATATSSTSVSLTWTASTSSNVTGYNIYRGPANGTLVQVSSSGTSPFVDTTAAPGTAYDYAVTAVSTGSPESARSNTASVTTPTAGGGGITAGPATVTQVTSAATSWTVNLPTFSGGEFMVVWLGGNVGSTAGTPAAPGWTTQVSTNESSGLKGTFLTRRMVAGDPSTVTVSYGSATLGVAEAVAFTGVNSTTPVDAKGGVAEASTTAVATHTTPTVTTTTGNDVLVSGFTTDKTSAWSSTGNTELADATAGTVAASVYVSPPMAVGSYSRSATATVASVKALSSLLALRP